MVLVFAVKHVVDMSLLLFAVKHVVDMSLLLFAKWKCSLKRIIQEKYIFIQMINCANKSEFRQNDQ